ncbi:MAG TPA: winged helix-turn-helix domain-containing protein [Patescibacteria group bacterium]|nr:winged helix-turn-helix domain-containing protein [Patescibacteria group bacterium]
MFEDLITSKTRVKILSLFLDNPLEMYHVREVVRRVDEEINAVRRELILLEKKGVLKREPRVNRVYYYLDKNYPFYFDMFTIHAKTIGLGADILKNKMKLGRIKFAMLSGKFARGMRDNPEEVDLLVVGTVVVPELDIVVRNEETRKKIEINYTVMTEEEFSFRKKRRDPFITSVIYGSRVMLIGDEEQLLA